jgi:hypothetical protein
MQLPPPGPTRKSAYAARKTGVFEQLVAEFREAETVKTLERLWERNMGAMNEMPEHWVDFLMAEFDERWEVLMNRRP